METQTKHTDKRTVAAALIALATALLICAGIVLHAAGAFAADPTLPEASGIHPLSVTGKQAESTERIAPEKHTVTVTLEGVAGELAVPATVDLVDSDGYGVGDAVEVTDTAELPAAYAGPYWVCVGGAPVGADGTAYQATPDKYEVDLAEDMTVTITLTATAPADMTDEELAAQAEALEAAGADATVITAIIEQRAADAQAQPSAPAQSNPAPTQSNPAPAQSAPAQTQQSAPAAHTHSWTTAYRKVWKDAEYKSKPSYDCKGCSLSVMDQDNYAAAEAAAKAHCAETGHPGYNVNQQKTIVRGEGYYDEPYTVCSTCGATK